MDTRLDIINEALGLAKSRHHLTSFRESDSDLIGSGAVRSFKTALGRVRSRHTWSFLVKETVLRDAIPIEASENSNFQYKFVKPDDFDKTLLGGPNSLGQDLLTFVGRINTFRGRFMGPYRLDLLAARGPYVFANFNPLYLTYTILGDREEDSSHYSSGFRTALVYGTAANMAVLDSGAINLSQFLTREFNRELQIAINSDLMNYSYAIQSDRGGVLGRKM